MSRLGVILFWLKPAQSTSFALSSPLFSPLSSPLSSPDGGWVGDCSVSSSLFACVSATWGCGERFCRQAICLHILYPQGICRAMVKSDALHYLPTRNKSLPARCSQSLANVGNGLQWRNHAEFKTSSPNKIRKTEQKKQNLNKNTCSHQCQCCKSGKSWLWAAKQTNLVPVYIWYLKYFYKDPSMYIMSASFHRACSVLWSP